MSSWTVELDWQNEPGSFVCIEPWWPDLVKVVETIRWEYPTELVTATVTVEAPSLLVALIAAHELVEGILGRATTLRWIRATSRGATPTATLATTADAPQSAVRPE